MGPCKHNSHPQGNHCFLCGSADITHHHLLFGQRVPVFSLTFPLFSFKNSLNFLMLDSFREGFKYQEHEDVSRFHSSRGFE